MNNPVAIANLTKSNYPTDWQKIDTLAIDTARILAADAVQKAGSGHPGTAMSLAPLAYILFQRIMNYDPEDPSWLGRDRFVLSCGHSSLTLYIQLFYAGFGVELDDLKQLRQWKSLTPGHPEYGHTPGVEITTGPLGQGIAAAIGMAAAARKERGLFDPKTKSGESPFDHYIYVVVSDGDIEEGVSAEASSFAGTQQLGNLIVCYDSNKISIEDDTQIAFTENVAARYQAYGWHVQTVSGGENIKDIEAAIHEAKVINDKPSLIIIETVIGYPAPNLMNTAKVHGAALGENEIKLIKEKLNFDPNKNFYVAPEILNHTRQIKSKSKVKRQIWETKFNQWQKLYPEKYSLYQRIQSNQLSDKIWEKLPHWDTNTPALATRKASHEFLNTVGKEIDELWGGSADLAESNNTTISGSDSFGPTSISTSMWKTNPYGRTIHFGIREHAMGAIMNGIALYGNTRVYGGTFLVFSDYMRPAVRLAALMKLPVIYIWTHDSIGLGEDGPTHQPVEHLASLRAIPGLAVIRPADANETSYAWKAILSQNNMPCALILTRQNLPILAGTNYEGVNKGGYVIWETEDLPLELIFIATGSEVNLAIESAIALQTENIGIRVVSMPCLEWFLNQTPVYQNEILPENIKKIISIEAGVDLSWKRFTSSGGTSISLEHFGASADYQTLFNQFGFTVNNIVNKAKTILKK